MEIKTLERTKDVEGVQQEGEVTLKLNSWDFEFGIGQRCELKNPERLTRLVESAARAIFT